MSALARQTSGITTSVPISEAIAKPERIARSSTPVLSNFPEPNWLDSVAHQITNIIELSEGWDGFRAGPIRRDVIDFAIHVLSEIMSRNTPAPHITPMSHEGLMIEWHENDIDLEVEIERPAHLWVSYQDERENIDEEKPISSDLSMLTEPINKLTKRPLEG